MIAAIMLYSIAAGSLLAAAAHVLDAAARTLRRSARGVWLVALAFTVALTASRFFVSAPTPHPVVPIATARSARGGTAGVLVALPRPSDVRPRVVASWSVPGTLSIPEAFVVFDVPLLTLWFGGSLAWGAILWMSAARIRRQRRAWRPMLLDGAPVYVSQDVGPALFGIIRYSIVVPDWVTAEEERRRRLILAHEREHARAGDPLLLFAGSLVALLLPWNAAVWLMFQRLRFSVEADCDARVLRGTQETRAYGDLLLDIGQRTLGSVAPVAAMSEPHSFLGRRITLMTRRHVRRAAWRSLVGTAAGILLVLAACQLPRPVLERRVATAAYATPRVGGGGLHPREAALRTTRVLVHIDSLGLDYDGETPTILVFTDGAARVGLGLAAPTALPDTLHLHTLPAMTLDVTTGDVHLQLITPGRIGIGGEVAGGPARHFSAFGRHIIVLRGGGGVRVLASDRGTSHAGPSARGTACLSLDTSRTEVPFDSLRIFARRLYPSAFEASADGASATIALLFDDKCRLMDHAFGYRSRDSLTVDEGIAMLLPNARVGHIRSGGLMDLRDSRPHSTWLVWAVTEGGDAEH